MLFVSVKPGSTLSCAPLTGRFGTGRAGRFRVFAVGLSFDQGQVAQNCDLATRFEEAAHDLIAARLFLRIPAPYLVGSFSQFLSRLLLGTLALTRICISFVAVDVLDREVDQVQELVQQFLIQDGTSEFCFSFCNLCKASCKEIL